jgi:lipopolysaccharide export LptBFGC system permease protein LptF
MKNSKRLAIISLLLGFGLGIATTSIINMLYPTTKHIEYSEEEIKNMAKQLGMVELKEYEQLEEDENYKEQNNNEDKNQVDAVKDKDNEEMEIISEEEEQKQEEKQEEEQEPEPEYITFTIEKGEKSEKIIDNLFNTGIIKDKDEFIDLVIQRKVGRKFIYGTYKIQKDISYDELIKLLCGK